MTNIGILSEEKIITLKSNSNIVIEKIKENENNEWLKDFFADANPFQKSKINVEQFNLILNADGDEINKHDLENAILLHKKLQITDSQASDERLWVSLCFGEFYPYMRNRWSMDKKLNLTEHWFCPHGQKRGLYFNGIARLYWFAKISCDETLEDPYELTKFCFEKDIDIIRQMIYRTYSNSKVIRLAILKALKSYVDEGGFYHRNILRKTLKYVSFLGGAYILDIFTEEELFEKIKKKLFEYEKEETENNKFTL